MRRFREIIEFRSTVSWTGSMRALSVDIEAGGSVTDDGAQGMARSTLAARVSQELRLALGLTVPVRLVEEGTLPRFEMKARRFVLEDGA